MRRRAFRNAAAVCGFGQAFLFLAQFARNFLNDLRTEISEYAVDDAGHVRIGGRVGWLLFNGIVPPDGGCHGSRAGLRRIACCR